MTLFIVSSTPITLLYTYLRLSRGRPGFDSRSGRNTFWSFVIKSKSVVSVGEDVQNSKCYVGFSTFPLHDEQNSNLTCWKKGTDCFTPEKIYCKKRRPQNLCEKLSKTTKLYIAWFTSYRGVYRCCMPAWASSVRATVLADTSIFYSGLMIAWSTGFTADSSQKSELFI